MPASLPGPCAASGCGSAGCLGLEHHRAGFPGRRGRCGLSGRLLGLERHGARLLGERRLGGGLLGLQHHRARFPGGRGLLTGLLLRRLLSGLRRCGGRRLGRPALRRVRRGGRHRRRGRQRLLLRAGVVGSALRLRLGLRLLRAGHRASSWCGVGWSAGAAGGAAGVAGGIGAAGWCPYG